MPVPNSDNSHEHTFKVIIKSFGKVEKTELDIATTLARTLRLKFIDWELKTEDDRQVIFLNDPNKDDYDSPLVVDELH